jgi:hypothetical protein
LLGSTPSTGGRVMPLKEGAQAWSGGGEGGETGAVGGETKAAESGSSSLKILRDQQKLFLRNNQRCARIPFIVSCAEAKGPIIVTVNPFVVLDGGNREKEAPPGALLPQVIGFLDKNSDFIDQTVLRLSRADSGQEYAVDISMPEDFVLDLELNISEAGAYEPK